MNVNAPCHCYSQRPFDQCCHPYLMAMALPPTAEALMRSRFSAFRLRDGRYLRESWDLTTRPLQLDFEQDQRVWSGLDIVATLAGSEHDERGVVEFKARYELGEETYLLHEVSRFGRHDGRWYYLDGRFAYHGKIAHKGVWLKNVPCHCGSGQKFKKCCGR